MTSEDIYDSAGQGDLNSVQPQGQASWQPDPWGGFSWRWWDGKAWSNFVGRSSNTPALRPALSWPVVVSAVPALALVVWLAIGSSAVAIPLAFVPLLWVPILIMLDRFEPVLWSSRIHSFLWGATVAIMFAGTINTVVAIVFDGTWAAIASAPIAEELFKGLAVAWAIRRGEVTSATSGIVIAAWAGLGFAVFEDADYFANAIAGNQLPLTLLLRGMTALGHSLMTAFIGLALGLAVQRKKPLLINAAWGYGIAIALHSLWNSAATYFGGSLTSLVVSVLIYFLVLFVCLFLVYRLVSSDKQKFESLLPFLAHRYQLSEGETEMLTTKTKRSQARASLEKQDRREFDRLHSALTQLAVMLRRDGLTNPTTEAILTSQLTAARNDDSIKNVARSYSPEGVAVY